MTLHICYGPATHEIHRESLGERWCFKCRKRREFVFSVSATIEPSYYGPNPSVRCTVCDLFDGDLFPGRAREWGDET